MNTQRLINCFFLGGVIASGMMGYYLKRDIQYHFELSRHAADYAESKLDKLASTVARLDFDAKFSESLPTNIPIFQFTAAVTPKVDVVFRRDGIWLITTNGESLLSTNVWIDTNGDYRWHDPKPQEGSYGAWHSEHLMLAGREGYWVSGWHLGWQEINGTNFIHSENCTCQKGNHEAR